MYEVRFLPPAQKYFKKLKDKKLLGLYKDAIEKISTDYNVGKMKKGDLLGIYGYDIFYNKTNYELAYKVVVEGDTIIVIIMAGTRENFYKQLKNYID